SLRHLADRADRIYLPGHGHHVADPAGMLNHQIAHRESRARQIMTAIEDGESDAAGLARRIYADVEPALLPAATRNVLSTLIWKQSEGLVQADGPISATSRFRRI
ncbi:MAG: MBL fold metallo-hydrolase, partial [Pseudomonadota bacterium]